MTFDRLAIAKTALCCITGSGATHVVRQIIDNNVNEPETLTEKIKIVAGTVVIGSMVGMHVRDFTSDKFDEMVIAAKAFMPSEDTKTE